jgi:hypothetical protein
MQHTRSHDATPRAATRRAIAAAVAASALLLACGNGSERGQQTAAAVPRGATEMTCENERGVVFPTVADLARLSTVVVTARATTSHTTTVTAPLSTYPPKSSPAPTPIPAEDRRNDAALQGRGYSESYFTDTTIKVESVLEGPSDFAGRTIVNRTNGDDIHECTALDPPATIGKSQLFFLSHDPVSDTYFTTTGSLSGRFEIKDGRVTASARPTYAPESSAATQLDGKTIAEVRSLFK